MAINFSNNNTNPALVYYDNQEVYGMKYDNQWVWAKPFAWGNLPTGGYLSSKTATNKQYNTISPDTDVFPVYSQVSWTYDYQDSVGVQGYFTLPRGTSSNENIIRFSFIKPTSNDPGDAEGYTKTFVNTGSISELVWTKDGKSETIVRLQKESANAFNINLSEWTDLEYYEEGRRMYGYMLKLEVSNYNGLLSTLTGTLHIPIMLGRSRISAPRYAHVLNTFSFVWNTIWVVGSQEQKTDYWKFVSNSGTTYHAMLGSNDENYFYYSTQESIAVTGRFYFYFEKKLYGNAQNSYFTRTSTYEPTATTGTISTDSMVYWGDVLNYYMNGSKKLTVTVENNESGVFNWNQYFLELPQLSVTNNSNYYRTYSNSYYSMMSSSITAYFYSKDHISAISQTLGSGGWVQQLQVGSASTSNNSNYPNFAYWTGTITYTIGGYTKTQNISWDRRPSSVADPTASLDTEVDLGGDNGTTYVYSYKLSVSCPYDYDVTYQIKYRMHHTNGSIGSWQNTTYKPTAGTGYWYHDSETEPGLEYEVYYYYLGKKSGTVTGSGGQLNDQTGGGGGEEEETTTA